MKPSANHFFDFARRSGRDQKLASRKNIKARRITNPPMAIICIVIDFPLVDCLEFLWP